MRKRNGTVCNSISKSRKVAVPSPRKPATPKPLVLQSCLHDLDLRVRHLEIGWLGSALDALVFRSDDYMVPSNEPEYFTDHQHGLSDEAFGIHKRVVPNYKEPWPAFQRIGNTIISIRHYGFVLNIVSNM